MNELPNLQLLRHEVNNEKRAKPFVKYLTGRYPDPAASAQYRRDHHIPDVDLATSNFREFFEARRSSMGSELRTALMPASGEPGTTTF